MDKDGFSDRNRYSNLFGIKMSLRNYIVNPEGQLRLEATQERLAALAGIGVGQAPSDLWYPANDIQSFGGVTNAIPTGVVPGWGHGPGVGGRTTVQILDRDFHDHRWANNPERFFWFGWEQGPNQGDLSQGSGWESGSVNPDGTARNAAPNPWRITFFEHGIKRCEELFGRWVGYSFLTNPTGSQSFPVRPLIMSGYADNDFFLHDLTVESAGTPGVVEEVCGWFQIPEPPAGKVVNRKQFGLQFGVDTTCRTPSTLILTAFKLCRYPGSGIPDIAPEDIKRQVEKEPMAIVRARCAHYDIE